EVPAGTPVQQDQLGRSPIALLHGIDQRRDACVPHDIGPSTGQLAGQASIAADQGARRWKAPHSWRERAPLKREQRISPSGGPSLPPLGGRGTQAERADRANGLAA